MFSSKKEVSKTVNWFSLESFERGVPESEKIPHDLAASNLETNALIESGLYPFWEDWNSELFERQLMISSKVYWFPCGDIYFTSGTSFVPPVTYPFFTDSIVFSSNKPDGENLSIPNVKHQSSGVKREGNIEKVSS